jgi:uncharacterized membrane protein YgcG
VSFRALDLALIACAAIAAPAYGDERILSFDSTITVAHDGTLEVRETIRVNAEGDDIKRGIYRDFPTIYPGRNGGQVVVGFAFMGAARDGVAEPWRTEARGNGVRIYLGNPQVKLTHGEHVYDLVYRTDRQMGYFADHDELYWNATGNGWGFPIDHASARVMLPESIPPADVRMEAYTGPQGAKGRDYSAVLRENVPTYSTTKRLEPGEGLTIVAMWPKGHITTSLETPFVPSPIMSPGYESLASAPSPYGSPSESILKMRLPHNRSPLWIAGFGFFGLLLYYYLTWNRVGRDPPERVTIPLYENPAGQTPASMRFLMQMKYDDKCFAAAVLSLAVKGYLRIEQGSGIFGVSKNYSLQKVAPPANAPPMSQDEEVLLIHIFRSGDRIELEQENYQDIRNARLNHASALAARFESPFFRINGGWHLLGILISILIAVVALSLPGQSDNWPEWYFVTGAGWMSGIFVLLGFVVNGVFGKLLKAPTVAGQAVMDRIRGFKKYLEVAEREDLKRIKGPPLSTQLFESYLPAALALGVEQAWAERFTGVFRMQADYRPGWYAGSGWNTANLVGFSSTLGSSLSSTISSSSTAPGSSSGGGGGGSSGGGGGGGGGGGW